MSRVVKIHAKMHDLGDSEYWEDGKKIHEQERFVDINDNVGAYIDMEIDIDTGQILNWKKPDEDSISDMIKEHEEYEKNREEYERLDKERAEAAERNRCEDFDELMRRGRKLYGQGFTDICPADEPRTLSLGWVFGKEDDSAAEYVTIRIRDWKRTAPKDAWCNNEREKISFLDRFKTEDEK